MSSMGKEEIEKIQEMFRTTGELEEGDDFLEYLRDLVPTSSAPKFNESK